MLDVNFEVMGLKEQIKEILIKHYHFIDCDDVAEELLNLHSVSNCLHENTYPIDRFGNSNCHDCGKFISHNDC